MGLPEQKWWRRLFAKKEQSSKREILTDVKAIQEFLKGCPTDTRKLLSLVTELQELVKEFQVAEYQLKATNLAAQAKVMDTLLEQYEFFQNDVDIAGIRLLQIASQTLKEAEKAGLPDLVREKRKHPSWQQIGLG